MSDSQHQVLADYVDAFNMHGRDSEQARKIYEDNSHREELRKLMDTAYLLHLLLNKK